MEPFIVVRGSEELRNIIKRPIINKINVPRINFLNEKLEAKAIRDKKKIATKQVSATATNILNDIFNNVVPRERKNFSSITHSIP